MIVDLIKQRLRYSAHIINLVAEAVLVGVDVDYFDDVLLAIKNDNSDDDDDDDSTIVSKFEDVLRTNDDKANINA
jgi:hypothetical protein